MTYETALKYASGDMPNEWYFRPDSKLELVRFIERTQEGSLIDGEKGELFDFGKTLGGKVVVFQGGGEFLDEDEQKPTPDYSADIYDTPEQAVDECLVGGKHIWPMAKGRRFCVCDAPMPYPDSVGRHHPLGG